MKQLLWKEWYELRFLPLASALCVALFLFTDAVYEKSYDIRPMRFDDTWLPLNLTWALFSVIAGAGLFAQESEGGGLALLSALPISRGRIWRVKVGGALTMLLSSILTSAAAWAAVGTALLGPAFFHNSFWHTPLQPTFLERAELVGESLLLLLLPFTIALAVSTFLDRPFSAVIVSLIMSIAYCTCLAGEASNYMDSKATLFFGGSASSSIYDPMVLTTTLLVLSVFVFTLVSYWTFTRGESLRTAKRFRVGAVTGLVSLAVVGLVLGIGSRMQLW